MKLTITTRGRKGVTLRALQRACTARTNFGLFKPKGILSWTPPRDILIPQKRSSVIVSGVFYYSTSPELSDVRFFLRKTPAKHPQNWAFRTLVSIGPLTIT